MMNSISQHINLRAHRLRYHSGLMRAGTRALLRGSYQGSARRRRRQYGRIDSRQAREEISAIAALLDVRRCVRCSCRGHAELYRAARLKLAALPPPVDSLHRSAFIPRAASSWLFRKFFDLVAAAQKQIPIINSRSHVDHATVSEACAGTICPF